jgi:hypothetical protein
MMNMQQPFVTWKKGTGDSAIIMVGGVIAGVLPLWEAEDQVKAMEKAVKNLLTNAVAEALEHESDLQVPGY